jgi:hypothetical protein
MFTSKDIEFDIDEVKEEATVRVGEQKFQIVFDYDAIILFFKLFGINPMFEPLGRDPGRLTALLWVGLLHFSPDLTPSVVNSWFTSPAAVLKLAAGVWRAFKMSIPEPDPKEAAPDPPSA